MSENEKPEVGTWWRLSTCNSPVKITSRNGGLVYFGSDENELASLDWFLARATQVDDPTTIAILEHRQTQAAWHREQADRWESGELDSSSLEISRIAAGKDGVDLGEVTDAR